MGQGRVNSDTKNSTWSAGHDCRLKERGLPAAGKKAEVFERLAQALFEESGATDDEGPGEGGAMADGLAQEDGWGLVETDVGLPADEDM